MHSRLKDERISGGGRRRSRGTRGTLRRFGTLARLSALLDNLLVDGYLQCTVWERESSSDQIVPERSYVKQVSQSTIVNQAEIEFTTRLDFLTNELVNIKSKLDLLFHLHERKQDRLDQMNVAPAFFGLVFNSFENDLVICLFRFFDADPKSASLSSFLSFAGSHLELFSNEAFLLRNPSGPKYWHPERQITNEIIDKQRIEIVALRPILDSLRLRRNKLHAHSDQMYVYQPLKLNDEASFTFNDAHKLIDVGRKTLDAYSSSFDNSFQSWDIINRFDIDNVLDRLYYSRKK